MKNKLIAVILCSGMIFMLAGCQNGQAGTMQPDNGSNSNAGNNIGNNTGSNTSSNADNNADNNIGNDAVINEHYKKLIDAAKEGAASHDTGLADKYGFSIQICISDSDYETLGYLIRDIDKDGTDELIFGSNTVEPDEWDGVIYNIFTISQGEPVLVLEGWDRNPSYFCENGIIENIAAGGAAYTEYNYYTYKNGSLDIVESVIYNGWKDEKNPWFYSTDPNGNAENAAPIDEDQANRVIEQYVHTKTKYIPFWD